MTLIDPDNSSENRKEGQNEELNLLVESNDVQEQLDNTFNKVLTPEEIRT